MSTPANRKDMHVFLGLIDDSPRYDLSTEHYAIKAIYRLNGDKNLKTEQYSLAIQSVPLGTSFITLGILSLQYSLVTDGLKVG